MKTIEEKAKAYDEARERAKKMYEQGMMPERLEYIFPDLKESEDERMMREFNDWLCEEIECRTNDLRDEKDRRTLNMLCYVLTKVKDWLERQKEHVPENEESGTRKEQKPIEFKNDELVEIIKGEFEGFRRLLKKKGIDYEPQYGYWEGFARLFDSSAREYVREQKPVEQKVSRSRIHYELLQNGIITMEEYLKLTENLYFPRVQKPAEWSEEDEKIMQTMIKEGDLKPSEIAWLKSLRPQPHWKPSEEQLKALKDAIPGLMYPIDTEPPVNHLKDLYEELKKL